MTQSYSLSSTLVSSPAYVTSLDNHDEGPESERLGPVITKNSLTEGVASGGRHGCE